MPTLLVKLTKVVIHSWTDSSGWLLKISCSARYQSFIIASLSFWMAGLTRRKYLYRIGRCKPVMTQREWWHLSTGQSEKGLLMSSKYRSKWPLWPGSPGPTDMSKSPHRWPIPTNDNSHLILKQPLFPCASGSELLCLTCNNRLVRIQTDQDFLYMEKMEALVVALGDQGLSLWQNYKNTLSLLLVFARPMPHTRNWIVNWKDSEEIVSEVENDGV